MATLNPGSSTLKSLTYEDALIEALTLYRLNLEPTASTVLTYSIAANGATFSASATLPLEVSANTDGTIQLLPTDETIDGFVWASDSSSDIRAASLAAQIAALVQKINAGTPVAGNTTDRVTSTVNLDAKTMSVNVSFALTPTPGRILSFAAQGYIQDF